MKSKNKVACVFPCKWCLSSLQFSVLLVRYSYYQMAILFTMTEKKTLLLGVIWTVATVLNGWQTEKCELQFVFMGKRHRNVACSHHGYCSCTTLPDHALLALLGNKRFFSVLPTVPIWHYLTFWPFAKMKKHLRRLRFRTAANLKEKVELWLHLQVGLFHHQSFESLNDGYDNFNRYGDYVEK
jgi:hypothetical protein